MREDMERILLTESDIHARVEELGRQISRDYAGREPLFVGVLKGCFIFMADLIRSVDLHCTMDFMAVSSYGDGTTTTGAVKINKDLSRDIAGQDVIIVEDILDSGVTLSYLKSYLQNRAPSSISIVTLLDKPYREFAGDKLTPDYSVEKSQEYYQNALPRLDTSLFSGARIIMRENETASAMLSVIMQEWQREFGFYCVVEELSEADFSARLSSGDYEIAVQELSGSVNSPGAYLQAFTTDGAGNYSGYHSADSDGLIKAAQRAADLADSAKLYAKAEQSIINGAAFIPLYYKNEYFCINKDFADIYYDPFNKTVDFTNAKAF